MPFSLYCTHHLITTTTNDVSNSEDPNLFRYGTITSDNACCAISRYRRLSPVGVFILDIIFTVSQGSN